MEAHSKGNNHPIRRKILPQKKTPQAQSCAQGKVHVILPQLVPGARLQHCSSTRHLGLDGSQGIRASHQVPVS